MPFYKKDNNELLVSHTSVIGPGFELYAETHDQHTYPVEGWWWFDTLEQAMAALAPTEDGSVTMRQARLALLQAGLLDQVDAAIAAIQDPVQRKAAEIEWEYSSAVKRDNVFVQTLSSALGLTEVQLNQLFATAAEL